MDNKEKQNILNSINEGKYKYEFEPSNSIEECEKYDGSKFYKLVDLDGPRSSTDLGTFTVTVQGEESHEFIYDMNCGDWNGDDFCEDEEIVEALEGIDEFIDYEDYDGDKQWEVYATVNKIPINSDYYWYEDEDCPTDIYSLGDNEAEIPVKYFIYVGHGASSEFMDMECTISDEGLYNIYKFLKEEDYDLDDENEIPGEEIQKIDSELYDDIMEQVIDQAENDGYDNEDQNLDFIVVITKEIFEEYL